MKKFKFRLEKVLSYRAAIAEDRKRELMLKNRAVYEETKVLEELEALALRDNFNESGIVMSQYIGLNGQFAFRLRNEIERQVLRLEDARKEAAEALEDYLEASREEKVLSSLKEKKYKEYVLESSKEEDKKLDELAIQNRVFVNRI